MNPEIATSLGDAQILIVDDEPANVRLLERILARQGYTRLTVTTDSREVLRLCTQFPPDLILLDLNMPHHNGFEVMEEVLASLPKGAYLPLLVLTADATPEVKRKALASGAKDFLTKPFDTEEVLLRVRNLLETRFLYLRLQKKNARLGHKVRERTQELEAAQAEILARLARACEYRDDDTGQHTYRVSHICALLARGLGLLENEVELIQEAAPLHDAGKIGIADAILLKPGRLTEEEFARMKEHAAIGGDLLSGGSSYLIQTAERIARTHHECWDGSGYPKGLKEDAIPLEGRIVAVADVFDALTHERPYKKAWPVEEAVAEIARQSGRQFDPRVVAVFLTLRHQALV